MDRLQDSLARGVLRISEWTASSARWLEPRLTQLAGLIQRTFARLPLTALQWILLAYVVLGLLYTIATPMLEASDELEHVAMIEALRSGNLPILGEAALWQEQAAQPPAYYTAAAVLTLPFDLSDFERSVQPNPYVTLNDAYSLGNKNLLLPPVQAWSTSFTAAVIVIRLLNVLFGLVTIAVVAQIAAALSPRRPSVALMAAALTAFNPMFIFITASVSNLPLAMLLNTLVILLSMHILRKGTTARSAMIGGLLISLAASVHLSGLLVGLVLLCVALYVARRDRAWAALGVLLGVTVVGVGAGMGWWLVRNQALYGDPLGWGTWRAVVGGRADGLALDSLLGEFAHFRRSFWGVFGADNVALSDIVYALLDMFTFVALFGVLYMILQLFAIRDFAHARRELVIATALLAVVLAGMVAYFVWLGQEHLVSGTSLFPFIGAVTPLLAAGFIEIVWWFLFFITPSDRSYVRAGDAVPNETLRPNSVWAARFLGVIALLTPLLAILPAYTIPQPLTVLPADIMGVYARYGDVELVGYDTQIERYLPGEMVPITLYWRVVQPTQTDWSVTMALVPPAIGNTIGRVTTYPGWGKLRTSTWLAGAIYADTYFVRLDPLFAGNFALRLHVVWWDEANGGPVSITDESGAPISSVLLDVGALIYARNFGDNFASLGAIEPRKREFDRKLRLEQFSFDRNSYQTMLLWDTIQPMDTDYTMFVQILNDQNLIVGQLDTQPALPTRFWRYGERYFTEHVIVTDGALFPGTYRVIVGVYDLTTMQRLALQDDPDDANDPADYNQLFTFTIGDDGSFASEELDTLQPIVTPEATPTAEATSDAPQEGTLQPEAVPLPPATAGG